MGSVQYSAGPFTNVVVPGFAAATWRSRSFRWATRWSSPRSGNAGTPAPFTSCGRMHAISSSATFAPVAVSASMPFCTPEVNRWSFAADPNGSD